MYQMAAMLLATTIAGSSATGGMPTADLNKICNQLGTKDCPIVQQVTGTSLEDLKQQLKEMGIQIDWNNCPDFNFPGVDIPKPDKPETDNPGTNKPETDKPEITPPETDQPGTESPDETPSENSYAKQVADLVNEERAKVGLAPLTFDLNISSAAQTRAKEIETSFSHTRPNGSSFSSVLTEAGINFRGAGENIAWGQRSPQEVVTGWMNSEGHRANILNKNYTSIGVGYYQNGSGTNYWTQLFTY
ncbi:CAP domain-containing protein [Diplocloster hominis]|uniref:CAP domain-containing protein n=1 Tax=Diplocloster hominis TaxID=3079010 RepID=UPI0031BAC39C